MFEGSKPLNATLPALPLQQTATKTLQLNPRIKKFLFRLCHGYLANKVGIWSLECHIWNSFIAIHWTRTKILISKPTEGYQKNSFREPMSIENSNQATIPWNATLRAVSWHPTKLNNSLDLISYCQMLLPNTFVMQYCKPGALT